MTRPSGGLKLFADELNPAAVRDILSWERHPELRNLLAALRSHLNRKSFFDAYAEAMMARHLRARDCDLRFEVRTPAGRRCDFEVSRAGQVFYLHLKRIDADRPPRRRLAVSSRLRILERIRRPYIVQLRWDENLTDEQMQRLVTQAAEFIIGAHVGDEMRARDHDGRAVGGVRIIAPWTGDHVNLTIGLPTSFIDVSPRIRRLMHRAYQQFMPRGVNVIAICSGHEDDREDFETALLGSHIERWDAHPPRGRRIAHGRAADGFWSERRLLDSRFAAWCRVKPAEAEIEPHLWVRAGEAIDDPQARLLRELFES